MLRFWSSLLVTLASCGPFPALAAIYLSDSPKGADIWVVITDNANAADCWVYSGDFTATTPSMSDLWVYATNSPAAADKWIIITDRADLGDGEDCLRAKQ